jgi:osmotically-inducible protein OsmY
MSRLTAIVVILASLLTSGCNTVMGVAAAGAGYYVGSDERSLSEITVDTSITARVHAACSQDTLVDSRSLDVDTFRKVVYLSGKQPNAAAASRAVALAEEVSGVDRVVSLLSVD